MRNTLAFAFVLAFAPPTTAQQQPYAGQHEREIKALFADEAKQYLSGAGMTYAKAAELNRYPGPQHTLECAKSPRSKANIDSRIRYASPPEIVA